MALTIKKLTNYSWMSQASYLDFTGLSNGTSGATLEARLRDDQRINGDKIFAVDQAKAFTGSATPSDPTDGFSFVSYAPNYQNTGFSATVFSKRRADKFTQSAG